MARRDKPLVSSFDSVADTKDINKNIDDNNNVNNNDDIFDNILNNNNKNDKVQKGIYFERDVAAALDKLVKKKKQSEFVNAAVRQILISKGLL